VTDNNKPSWDQLRDEASSWLARMDSGSTTLKEFEVWRGADPRHAAAFIQVANSLKTLDRLKPELKKVVPQVKRSRRRQFLFGGIAAVAAAGGVGLFTVARAKTTVRTAIGETKRLDVPGGHMLLNTDTEIQMRTHRRGADIWLNRGELALTVSDSQVTCVLHAAGRVAEIRQGTVNARLRGKMLDLAVSSGELRLKTDGGSVPAPSISANHAVLVSGAQEVVRPLSAPDAEFIAGWQSGEMVFQGQTLETAVAEYNRYLTRKIYIADPSLAAIRLGGRFTTHDPQLFLHSLQQSFGIRVNDSGTDTIVLTK
jgi:transmembrane sensor